MPARLKVLVIDDERDLAWTTATLLEMAGCEVRISTDPPAALVEAREFRPDVCVIDLNMPRMHGTEVAKRLQAQAGDHPPRLVALTGRWDVDSTHRTRNAGFERHLVKPAAPDRLVEAVLGEGALAAV